MATLVLTAVGNVVGGPIGGAIGALIGNTIDQRLLPPSREGPRLGNLSVQTSSYGSAIPRLFGRMRVAGTVIWSTDLIEDRHREGGVKGSAKTTTYSYSVSFAVLLSGRPIRAVGRIWADGKLLRGTAGDWKSAIGAFRLHPGGIGEPADPLIASAEGADATPAYDDLAYAVFEQLQLADFGNRIPSLTFEVVADDGDVSVDAIAADLSHDVIAAGQGGPAAAGFAAAGASVRDTIGDLVDAFSLSLGDDGARLRLLAVTQDPVALSNDELGTAPGMTPATRIRIARVAAGATPDEVQLGYYDPARDWGAGLQRARGGRVAAATLSIALPAALSATDAKACAEARLAALDAARATATATLGWRRLGLGAGAGVLLPTPGWSDGGWQVARVGLEKMVLTLTLRGLPAAASATGAGSSGRAIIDADHPVPPTRVLLLDISSADAAPLVQPRLLIAAAGTAAGWRSAALSLSLDDGVSWTALGRTAGEATVRTALVPPAAGSPYGFDTTSSIEVELQAGDMDLGEADDDRLIAGANLALIGDELVQFGSVQPLGGRRFRLSRLLRGRRGTEWAMGSHAASEPFVLLDPDSLQPLDLPASTIGAPVCVSAIGLGDTAPAIARMVLIGRSVRPPDPIALSASRDGDGAIALAWVRRSRAGWSWIDGADAPLAEESERYVVTVSTAGGRGRTATVSAPAWTYDAAMQAADRATAPFTFSVAQAGTLAPSLPPATLTIA